MSLVAIVTISSTAFMTACKRNKLDNSYNEKLTIERAQTLFDKEYTESLSETEGTLSLQNSDDIARDFEAIHYEGYKLNPGDFTVRWEQAIYNYNPEFQTIEAPIITTYKYEAVKYKTADVFKIESKTHIQQKLIIKQTGQEVSIRIAYSIPNNQDNYNNTNNDLVLLYNIKNDLVELSQYRKGILVNVANINSLSQSDFSKYVRESMSSFTINRLQRISLTKSDLDDSWGGPSTLTKDQAKVLLRNLSAGTANLGSYYNNNSIGYTGSYYQNMIINSINVNIRNIDMGFPSQNGNWNVGFDHYRQSQVNLGTAGMGTAYKFYNEAGFEVLRITVENSQNASFRKAMNID